MTEKEQLLRKLNEAFACSDTGFILAHVSDHIRWNIVGDRLIEGKEMFRNALKEMESERPLQLTIHHVITHGSSAAVSGTLQDNHTGTVRTYSFCDIYKFSGFKNPKIKELTSYVLEIT